MRVLHLGGSRLGERIRALLQEHDEVVVADDRETLRHVVSKVEPGTLDWIVSSGYRWIVSESVLKLADDSCNVHTSLLPWGRGAHPNVWAIVDREPAGVTLHRMVADIDAGPIFAQRPVTTSFADTGKDLHRRLEDAAVELFAESWPLMRERAITPEPQGAGGSHHLVRDLRELADLDFDAHVTWRRALDVLRALTFPPHRNITVDTEGRRYHVELTITDVTDEPE